MNHVQRMQAKVIELRPQIKHWTAKYNGLEDFMDDAWLRVEELGENHVISIELKEQIIQAKNEMYQLEDIIEEAYKRIDELTSGVDKELARVYNNTYSK